MTQPSQLELHFEPVITPKGDGSFLVRPGKPIIRQAEITVHEAAAILGRSVSHVYHLIKVEGVLQGLQRKPKARYRLLRSEVEALARRQRTS